MKVEEEQESTKQNIPPEIIINEILTRASPDSILVSKLVSKSLRASISNPSFIHHHIRNFLSSQIKPQSNPSTVSLYLYELTNEGESLSDFNRCVDFDDNDDITPFKVTNHINDREIFDFEHWPLVIGSVNGLICLFSMVIYILNPFTVEAVKLPKFNDVVNRGLDNVLGFGYVPCTDEYKVVGVFYGSMIATKGKIQVYTLGSGSGWRDVGEVNVDLRVYGDKGVYVDGGIHWLNKKLEIVRFDLEMEEFRVLKLAALPPVPRPAPVSEDMLFPTCRYMLGVLGGRFCVQCEGDGGNYDLWVLEGEESWVKKFSIPWEVPDFSVEHLALLRSGRLLLTSKAKKASFCYDPRTGKLDTYRGFYGVQVTPYVKSFVSLKDIGEDASAMVSSASLDVGGGEDAGVAM